MLPITMKTVSEYEFSFKNGPGFQIAQENGASAMIPVQGL
jgi:hypothetical protein